MSQEHWSVSVERNGENVVTIESNCMSGRDISEADAETIRTAARHLLSFVGERKAPNAGATKPSGSQAEDAHNLPSALLRERPQEP